MSYLRSYGDMSSPPSGFLGSWAVSMYQSLLDGSVPVDMVMSM